MNPLMQMLMQNRQNGVAPTAPQNSNTVMRAAFLAMMSGQSPQDFLKTLPQCQGLDLSNLTETSKKLCQEKGIDYEQAKANVTNQVNNMKN